MNPRIYTSNAAIPTVGDIVRRHDRWDVTFWLIRKVNHEKKTVRLVQLDETVTCDGGRTMVVTPNPQKLYNDETKECTLPFYLEDGELRFGRGAYRGRLWDGEPETHTEL